MVSLLPYIAVCVAVLVVFGLPATLALLPDEWRPWWPAVLPLAGLATLVCVMQLLGTLFTAGGTAWLAVGLAVAATVALFVRGARLVRPSWWAVGLLVVAAAVAVLALQPSLKLGEPRPSGIAVQDPIYYLVLDQWLDDHGIRDEPPPPQVDGFWATAHNAWEGHLRVGVDLADVVTARVASTDPMNTMPVLTALYAAALPLAVALLVIALRGPPWAAFVAAGIAGSRPDLMRAALETNIAQLAGLGLFVAAIGAIVLVLLRRTWQAIVLAGLLCAGVIGTYVEFAPSLVVSAAALGVAAALLSRVPSVAAEVDAMSPGWSLPDWRAVVRAFALLAVAVVALNPLAVYNGLRNLAEAASLSGESVVPFLGVERDIGLVLGPDSIVVVAGSTALAVAAVVAVLACLSLLQQPRWRAALLVAGAAGALLLMVWQAWLAPYSYGLYKSTSLLAPFAAATLAFGLLARVVGLRVVTGVGIAVLLAVNLSATRDVSDLAVAATLGMTPDDAKLDDYRELVGGRTAGVAVENADLPGAVNAREHFAVYWLRAREGLRVTYRRGTGSYFQTNLAPRFVGLSDRTYDARYDHVVSYGESLTHGQRLGLLGAWQVYRREGQVDLLQVGPDGWGPLTSGRWGPYRQPVEPAGRLWINATRPSRVRVTVTVFALGRRSEVTVVDKNGPLVQTGVGPRARRITTKPFNVSAGRTEILLLDDDPFDPAAGPPGGIGMTRARVQEVPR